MLMKPRVLLVCSAFAGLGGALSGQVTTVALSDAFAEATARSSGGAASAPLGVSSATQWYESSNVLSVSDGAMAFQPAASATVVAFYAPQTLTYAGDSISLAFDFRVTAPANINAGLRLGLFDSGGNLPTPNSNGLIGNGTSASTDYAANAPWVNYKGYISTLNPTGAGAFSIQERAVGTSQSLISTTNSVYAALKTATGQAFEEQTDYHGVLTFTLNETGGLDIYSAITGGLLDNYAVATTDATPATLVFDTISFYLNVNSSSVPAAGTLTLDNIRISTLSNAPSPIPEPSTYAVIAGAAMLTLGVIRRRRRT